MKNLPRLLLAFLPALGAPSLHGAATATAWPQFRGPGGNAIAAAQSIPLEFGPGKHQLWKTSVPTGHSSPCVWGDRIFLTGHVDTTLKMLCLRRSDGKLLWERERKIAQLPRYLHIGGGPANSTPATDGERVYFQFDDYGIIATDFAGELVWEKKLPTTGNAFSYGASPIVDDGQLYLNRDGGIESSLLCLDARTGAVKWTTERTETIGSYCTPYILGRGGEKQILAGGSGRLQAYDPGKGSLLWTVTGLPVFVCTSAVENGGMIFFGGWTTAHVSGRSRIEAVLAEAPGVTSRELEDPRAFFDKFDTDRDNRISASEFPAGRGRDAFNYMDKDKSGFLEFEEWSARYNDIPALKGRNVLFAIASGGLGDITETHVKWEVTKGLPYVSSPVAYRERVYLLKAGGFLSCLDVKTGKAYYESGRLDVTGEYYSTPVAVGDHLVICAQRGIVLIVKVGDQLEVVARNDLAEPISATPAIVDDTIYIRSDESVWAFRSAASVARAN